MGGNKKGEDSEGEHELVSCFWRQTKTPERQEYGRSFQTNRISAGIIGFVITKALSLHSALHSVQTCNLDKQMDGH